MVEIIWIEEAQSDLDDIMAYISKSSKQYAETLLENIFNTIEKVQNIIISFLIHCSKLFRI